MGVGTRRDVGRKGEIDITTPRGATRYVCARVSTRSPKQLPRAKVPFRKFRKTPSSFAHLFFLPFLLLSKKGEEIVEKSRVQLLRYFSRCLSLYEKLNNVPSTHALRKYKRAECPTFIVLFFFLLKSPCGSRNSE